MNPTLRYCRDNPQMVGLDGEGWLSTNPIDYDWNNYQPSIGCNNLYCMKCNAQVRWRLRIGVADWSRFRTEEIYILDDWLAHPAMGPEKAGWIRFYLCRCSFWPAITTLPTDDSEEQGPHLPWQCAGHPKPQLPIELDGIHVDVDTDFATLARRTLPRYWPAAFGELKVDGYAFWLRRLYHLLPEPSQQQALSKAVADMLTDPLPELRSAALRFFQFGVNIPNAERLVYVLMHHRDLYAGVLDPLLAGAPLDEQLVEMVGTLTAFRNPQGQPLYADAETMVREEMLLGRCPPAYIHRISRMDLPWLVQHAAEIAKVAPQLVSHLIFALNKVSADQLIPIIREFATIQSISWSDICSYTEQNLPAETYAKVMSVLNKEA